MFEKIMQNHLENNVESVKNIRFMLRDSMFDKEFLVTAVQEYLINNQTERPDNKLSGMAKELHRMWKNGIQVKIECFYDKFWTVGVSMNVGDRLESHFLKVYKTKNILPTLQELIKKHFPGTNYEKKYLKAALHIYSPRSRCTNF